MSNRVFEYAFKVRLHDVDGAGVVFFARLFVHAHDAYEEFMSQLGAGLDTLIGEGAALPVAHAGADCLVPLRHGEAIGVELAIGRLGRTSFTVEYVFRAAGEVRARLETVHVFLDPHSRQPAALPQALRQRLLPYAPEFA